MEPSTKHNDCVQRSGIRRNQLLEFLKVTFLDRFVDFCFEFGHLFPAASNHMAVRQS
jgi:hypothetical protein